MLRGDLPPHRPRIQQPRGARVLRAAGESGPAAHLELLREIFRFNREAPRLLDQPDADGITLGEFLDERRFGEQFTWRYLMPMASAIWSASLDAIRQFPAATLIRFLDNHGLLAISRQPQWKVVRGGSKEYIPKLLAPLGHRVHAGVRISAVTRAPESVTVSFLGRSPMRFDEVVFACHGDQVLPMLADASVREREVFGRFATTSNEVWLHTDASVLPRRQAARASWNYLLEGRDARAPTVTYHLNRLQSLTTPEQFCVTLNPRGSIDERQVIRRMVYEHPLYTRETIRAQARWAEVSGVNRTHYCGAYWSYGFHEDGLRSALRVASALGVEW